jgi:guanosine-3',5'-bis(diphosphate) 3'-pyrophosphohydrolase
MKDISLILLEAAEFAADKHKFQRRKGSLSIPYINHPIKVSKLIAESGTSDLNLLIAALLHDTLEDTDTTEIELTDKFGKEVASLVLEVTDNMKLSQTERKELQVTKAPNLSANAKILKIADKICNINDMLNYPISWSRKRKIRYVEWSKRVVQGCKGQNVFLDKIFEETCGNALKVLLK